MSKAHEGITFVDWLESLTNDHRLTFLNPPKSTRQSGRILEDSGNYSPATITLHASQSLLKVSSMKNVPWVFFIMVNFGD